MLCRRADRLGYLCIALNLTTADFADHLDLPLRRARRLLKPDRKPSHKLLRRVHRAFPHISCLWLFCGEGDMFSQGTSREPPNAGNYVGANYGTVHQTITCSGRCASAFHSA